MGTDALADARAMGLPAAAVARLARLAGVSLENAEVLAMRLVNDLREAAWTVWSPPTSERTERSFPLPTAQPIDNDIRMIALALSEHIWPSDRPWKLEETERWRNRLRQIAKGENRG